MVRYVGLHIGHRQTGDHELQAIEVNTLPEELSQGVVALQNHHTVSDDEQENCI